MFRNYATVIVAILLLLYVCAMLFTIYRSQENLQTTLFEQLRQETERRASAVEYFFSERRDDLTNIARSREISVFFENRALGMSMEYGLMLSLVPIKEQFKELLKIKKIGDDAIYSRIVLIDAAGNLLADTELRRKDGAGRENWKEFLNPGYKDGAILYTGVGSESLVSTAYYFKNRYEGQIIAWIRCEKLYDNLLRDNPSSRRVAYIVTGRDNVYLPHGDHTASSGFVLPDFTTIEERKQIEFTATSGTGKKNMLAVRVAVKNTPFSLINVVSAEEVNGFLVSRTIMLTLSIMAVMIFGGAFFLLRVNMRSLVLHARLDESAKRENEIQENNRRLEEEIAERKRVEEELRKAHELLKGYSSRLEDEVRERTRQAMEAQVQAETANRAKSDFLMNMSHELKTPLNAVIGFSETLRDGLGGELNEKQAEYVGYIYKGGKHLHRLVNDILDLSKIEAGKLELEFIEFRVKDLIESSLLLFKDKAARHKLTITSDLDDRLETITADATRVRDVLCNLLSNAIKFTPEGGSILVSASLSDDGESVEISVTDTGIGISPESRQQLFKPFTQLDSSYTKKYEGTGLGLILCRKIVELHGGTISVRSEPGKGSTFSFSIPFRPKK